MREKFAKAHPLSAVETVDNRLLLRVLSDFRKGDFSVRLPVDSTGIAGKVYDTINEIIDLNSRLTGELERISSVVGKEGKIRQRATLPGAAGGWAESVDAVNSLVGDLIQPITDVSRVIGGVAKGDLSQTMDLDVEGRHLTGEFLRTANTVNTMVDQLSTFTSEVIRVAREVGTEGKLGGQAKVKGVSGAWKDLADNVNSMAANLTNQVRNIAEVTTAVAKGDLSKKITVDVRGEILELKNTINTMVDQLNSFASEVTRVAREVGTEGKLGGQAVVKGAGGTWKDLTDSVNFMANNLTRQVRNIADVTTAVARGDLSKKITVDVRGEILELKNTINIMVDQLNSFASEVTRVAREVGTEGRLGGQADVKGVGGTWKVLTDSVNFMASNLTSQVRNIAAVTTAVAKGDLSKKITVDARGEILELKSTVNTMVDQLNSFASEVTRVAREVGTEGRLGGQADVKGVGGTWKDLTDSVNFMAGNLTSQVRNIADVSTAIASGDLSKKITVDVKGEILELKNTINTMVDQLNSFASEVTRVAREVGTEGLLGGQAEVEGIAGTWRDLTESVNFMASNLTNQVRNIAAVTTAVARGDLSKKITVDARGEILELKNTVNIMVDQLNSFAWEVTRVAREVGTEGKLGGQADVRGVAGTWKDLTDSVNFMAGNLTAQVRNIAAVTTAVANGDLSKKITVEVRGEILELKNTINTMVDQLNSFASEVTRVAREVGTEGRLGGQAEVKGVGTWKDLTASVNFMASNLTAQVRSISKVVTSVANGNLKRKLVLEAKGEIEQLAETINEMIDNLATFAEQVSTVAREVGIEGKLGGQANVPNAAGTWRDLTNNVNRMAAALTSQVRAIADVATAVTTGDLSRSITVDAAGEVAALKDNINEMIRNLRETTTRNTEQDWLKTNLARFTRLLQGQRDLLAVSKLILTELAPLTNIQHGVIYINDSTDLDLDLRLLASYAFNTRKHIITRIRAGEGIVGQAAFEQQRILLTDIPADYIQIGSALGEGPPVNVIVLPVLFEGQVKAVIELASFHKFSEIHLTFFDQLTEIIGIMLNTITATMRTEELLKQSQSLAVELQSRQAELTETNAQLQQQARTLQESEERLKSQQEELQQTNEELEEKARLLFQQNKEVERKNAEIEKARSSLEEKADQLALTSKYKSEFLANMSHELRTPLNSMLILSRLLGENQEGNLNEKQIEYAQTIHSSGDDLLQLINEILDLSKVESGNMEIDARRVLVAGVRDFVQKNFEAVARAKGLKFSIDLRRTAPRSIITDEGRLQQVLKNLLSNAFKFTAEGSVTLRIESRRAGWSPGYKTLDNAEHVVAFSVMDTGIGIPADKHRSIFEAFQQADGTITREYGGTGLGLSISREIAHLLGGEIRVSSEPGKGSTFTLYLPWTSGLTGSSVGEQVRPDTDQIETPLTLPKAGAGVADDRENIENGDRILLIVDTQVATSGRLLHIAREHGFKAIVETRPDGVSPAIRDYNPDAISLAVTDEAWVTLDRLKHDLTARHIPVQVVGEEKDRQRALSLGAFAFVERDAAEDALARSIRSVKAFVERQLKRLLVVEYDDSQRKAIVDLVGDGDIETTAVSTGEEALRSLRATHFDCVVIDLGLPDTSGFDVLETMKKDPGLYDLPVIVYTAKEVSPNEEIRLRRMAESIIIKEARSPERLLAETSLFLHRVSARMPAVKRRILENETTANPALAGKKVLVIDDDVRNIFSLTSFLERHHMEVIFAENGRDGLELLKATPDVDAILVDIMMPEMDGYQTMREIRKIRSFVNTLIIAVTAKALKGDLEKCLEAGASDYVSKPADVNRLLSLLRMYLAK